MSLARLTAILLDVLRVDGELDQGDLIGLVEPAFPPSEPYWNVRRCVGIAVRDLADKGLVERQGDHVAFRGRPAALAR